MEQMNPNLLQQETQEDALPWLTIPCFVGGYVLIAMEGQGEEALASFLFGLALVGIAVGTLLIRPRNHLLAALLLGVGSFLVIRLAGAVYHSDDIGHVMLLPVLAATVTMGVLAGSLGALLASLTLLAGALIREPEAGSLGHVAIDVAVIWGGVFMEAVATRTRRNIVTFSWQGYREARMYLEEARARQLELKQALDDLALATAQVIRLNEMLSMARKAVEDARKAKEEFVASVSHEFRTPLNMIIGFSDLILESPEVYGRGLPPTLLADISAIRRNSQHLACMVDDVLDLAQMDAGHMRLALELSPIPPIINEAVQAVAGLFRQKHLTLNVEVADDLMPVRCDTTRIRQVVLNLLSNAARFTVQGGVRVKAGRRQEMLVVSVSDTGPGLRPEEVRRLFQPFTQADSSGQRQEGGSGLGLAISKRLIEMHGGQIWLESEVDVGTTVFFSLPMVHMPAASTPATPVRWFTEGLDYALRTRQSAAPRLDVRPVIVVMEDGHAMTRLLSHRLGGLEVVTVRSVEELNVMVDANAPVAILLNEMPGCATQQPLHSIEWDVPIISCWLPESNQGAGKWGVQDYLVKPVNRSKLLESIHRVAPSAHTILVVDDDAETGLLLRRMLMTPDASWGVLYARDGESGLALLTERRPDLLLLDLTMPNTDGPAVLLAKARDARIRDIPTIIVSARDARSGPLVVPAVNVTCPYGLSGDDLVQLVQTVMVVLKPRFGGSA